MIKRRLPDDGDGYDDAYNAGWNACHTAMLIELDALDVDMFGNPVVPKTTLVNGSPVTSDHAAIGLKALCDRCVILIRSGRTLP